MSVKKIDNFMLPPHFNDLYKNEAISSISLTRDVAAKINELIAAYNELSQEDLFWKHTMEGKIEKGVLYMKDNLINSIHDLFELLKSSGDLAPILFDVSKDMIDSLANFTSPEIFGAVGDGIADDTEAIRSALNSGKNTILLSGTYMIRSNIKVDKDHLRLVGGHLILNDQENEEFILEFTGDHIHLEDVTFEHKDHLYTSNQGAQNGIKFSECHDVTLRKCRFLSENARINGLLDFYNDWSDILIDQCYFKINTYYDHELHGGGVWIRDMTKNGCKNVTIQNCVFESESKDEVLAVWSETSKGIQNVNISGCEFIGSGMAHLMTVCGDHVNITRCRFHSRATNTILKCFFDQNYSTDLLISECSFLNINNDVIDYSFRSVHMINGGRAKVKNSLFKGYSFSCAYADLYQCEITATENRSVNASANFYNCMIDNIQTKNQFIAGGVMFNSCNLKTKGLFIQPVNGGTCELLSCHIESADRNMFVSAGSDRKFIVLNNHFTGEQMPDIYSMKNTDVFMNNYFKDTPNPNNGNPVQGWTTNIVG